MADGQATEVIAKVPSTLPSDQVGIAAVGFELYNMSPTPSPATQKLMVAVHPIAVIAVTPSTFAAVVLDGTITVGDEL